MLAMNATRPIGAWGLTALAAMVLHAASCKRPPSVATTAVDSSAKSADALVVQAADESKGILFGLAGGPVPYKPSVWIQGAESRVRFGATAIQTRHDTPYGSTRIELEFSDTSRPAVQFDEQGVWRVFGYCALSKRYVAAGAWEQGAWEPFGTIAYIDERTGKLLPWQDKSKSWMGFAAVPSADSCYLALVGSFESGPFRLQLLNTRTDEVRDLGKPPAPPPSDFCGSDEEKDLWGWGSGVDGVVEFEKKIVSMVGSELVVSFGKDTCDRRARHRVTKRWPLRLHPDRKGGEGGEGQRVKAHTRDHR